MKRREFLGYGLGLLPLIATHDGFTAVNRSIDLKKVFSSFIDVLVPRDQTPSASELRVDSQILTYSTSVEHYEKLIQLGCYWLELHADALFKLDFISLSDEQKVEIVSMMEVSKIGSIEKQFFDRVLSDTFRFYYGNPASWVLLPITIPPQPLGYPGYSTKGVV